jgi:hypothetical protein
MMKLKLLAGAIACLALWSISTSAASAKICSTAGTGVSCGTGHGNVYRGPISFALSESTATLTSGFTNITCSASEGQGEVTNGESGVGNLTSLTFSGCKDNMGNSCTETSSATNEAPWEFTTALNVNTNGVVRIKKSTTEWSCILYTCKYITGEYEGLVEGGETASIAFNKVIETKETGSSAFCSSTATLSGSYKIKTPDSLFIT